MLLGLRIKQTNKQTNQNAHFPVMCVLHSSSLVALPSGCQCAHALWLCPRAIFVPSNYSCILSAPGMQLLIFPWAVDVCCGLVLGLWCPRVVGVPSGCGCALGLWVCPLAVGVPLGCGCALRLWVCPWAVGVPSGCGCALGLWVCPRDVDVPSCLAVRSGCGCDLGLWMCVLIAMTVTPAAM